MFQIPLPKKYTTMTEEQLGARITEVKRTLGPRLVILGHHYQREEVIAFADYHGDSLELSRRAAQQQAAAYIVFCGVHFMAESADILTRDDQQVILPDLTAGCSMADMAGIDQVEYAWSVLARLNGGRRIVPVSYVNSTAAIKAFCGTHEGMCCTSSNCEAVLRTVWRQDAEALIFFLPDQHLGRNTGFEMGIPLETMVLYDPFESDGELSAAQVKAAQMVLWDGFCSVHQQFTPEQIAAAREADEHVRVIVHPECCFEVTLQADVVGSTAKIIKEIEASAAGTHWVVGTELNLVNRLTKQMAAKGVKVESLSACPCLCETMYRIDLPHLCWALDELAGADANPEKKVRNRIAVDETVKRSAKIALERMLAATH